MSENALTPGSAVWNYIKNSVPSQLGAAGHLAQSVAQPFTNLFGNGGAEFWNGPQDPQAAHDMSNALMTMYAGSAAPEAGALSGEAPALAVASSPLASHVAEAGSGPFTARVYRGTRRPGEENWPPQGLRRGQGPFWASNDPEAASMYAGAAPWHDLSDVGGVIPADVRFKNPMIVDAEGANWNRINHEGHRTDTDSLIDLARERRHDGLVIRNVRDDTALPQTTYAALRPGTVKSPLTGETLFSGSDKAPNPVAAAMMAESQPQNAMTVYRGSPVHETWPPAESPITPGTGKNDTFWASTNPKVAATYAERLGPTADPNIIPAEADFKNPLVVDAGGNDWMNIPTAPHFQHLFGNDKAVSSDMLAMKARDAGHDGLVLNNVLDHLGGGSLWNKGPKPATTIAALRPGTVKSPLTGETLFSGSDKAPNPVAAALMAESQPQNALTGIKAFHGSPYDFDKFDASKIGTGEGAQAYGHGLYFAESPGVAESYKNVGVKTFDDKAAADAHIKALQDWAAAGGKGPMPEAPGQPPGKMYEVNINADPASFLDWDKPLAEQPHLIGKLRGIDNPLIQDALQPFELKNTKGSTVVSSMSHLTGDSLDNLGIDHSAGTAALSKAGIPGIRYLDQGSRAVSGRAAADDYIAALQKWSDEGRKGPMPTLPTDQPTYNYVIFPGNEHLIEIVKKYGIAGAATMLGLSQSDLHSAVFGNDQQPTNALAR